MNFKNLLIVGAFVLAAGLIGFQLNSGKVNTIIGANPGPDHYQYEQFFSGLLFGNTNSTSTTATSQTLKTSDIQGYDTVVITPNTGSLTLTFPASSTMASFLPKTGQRQRTCFMNGTTTAGINITFAAGTGIDIETASSSPTDLTLLSDNTACFEIVRKRKTASSFDFSVLMTEFTNGD